MKYVITETQLKLLKEITYVPERWGTTNVDDRFFQMIKSMINSTILIREVRNYFNNVVGVDLSTMPDKDIYYYISTIGFLGDNFPEELRNVDVISNLAYYLANKFLKIKKGKFGLDYTIDSQDHFKSYYFFDSEIEELVGYFSYSDASSKSHVYSIFPKGTVVVKMVMVDHHVQGSGYGKAMYLTILSRVDCLASDNYLFYDSLNMWVNVLPSEVPFVGFVNDKYDVKRLTKKSDVPDIDVVECFFACNDPKLVKKIKV